MIVTASVLNVRVGPGLAYRAFRRVSRGDEVEGMDVKGDWQWIEPGGGWVHRAFLAREEAAAPAAGAPDGPAEIVARFGEPGGPACSAGRAVLPAPLKLGWQDASVSRFACHELLEDVFTAVFRDLYDSGLWDRLRTFDGCYATRSVRGRSKPSTHSWGIAVDLNAATNGLRTSGDMDPDVVRVFERHGFTWGGRWSRKDPMHFQYATGY